MRTHTVPELSSYRAATNSCVCSSHSDGGRETMDISQLTAKERRSARKELLKMIDSYNKQQRKTRRPSFPLSPPSQVVS